MPNNIHKNILKKKTIKYSKIRANYNIIPEKDFSNNYANFTHYLQNIDKTTGKYFKSYSDEFVNEFNDKFKLRDSFNQPYLPIKWDVPFPPPSNPKFTFIDLFAGIGGMRLAFQNLGGKCVYSNEWNQFCKKTYDANFGEVPFGDITKVNEYKIPDHDILVAGFPCQPFSIAGVSKKNALGKAHGFLDATQGTLFFDIARIIDAKKPSTFLLENVKNLTTHDKENTFKVIIDTLTELEYSLHYKVMDGKHFVPQHRERIIIIGFRKDTFNAKEDFAFPGLSDVPLNLSSILESNVDPKYTLTKNLWIYLQKYAAKHKAKGNGFGFGLADLKGISRTLSARYYKDGSEILIPQKGKIPRRLTPRECARLQGFPENFIIPVSDHQAYKQFGNSVVVPLIQSVGKNLVRELLKVINYSKLPI